MIRFILKQKCLIINRLYMKTFNEINYSNKKNTKEALLKLF